MKIILPKKKKESALESEQVWAIFDAADCVLDSASLLSFFFSHIYDGLKLKNQSDIHQAVEMFLVGGVCTIVRWL